ncbi:TonB-dependent receptor domain-containing protein [Erythrobacter sp. NE805]|uniref:TonB-dependent receptor domain-containing protein n=1 Tax=Erythrobacter sp. NE805 TaxID=3389875 RepID=UPI00396B315E
MKPLAPLAALAVIAAPAPLAAREAVLAIPPGTAAEVAIGIARATDASIVIADPALGRTRVPGLKGRMDAEEAVRKLAKASGMQAVRVGPGAWRLVAAPPKRPSLLARARPARPVPVAARPPSAPVTEAEGTPITVTASKRDLLFQQVAGQVTLLDGARLEAGGVGGTERITQRAATVSSTYLGSGRNKLFIRGIADSSFTGPTQATVGQYFGDLRLSYNAPDPDLRLSDMERVEILEGPQGTLYGAGSLGGIIRLVPRAPEPGETLLIVSGGASAIAKGEPGGDAHATVNLPLSGETATLRLNLDAATLGGYIDKPVIGRRDVNRTNIFSGRAALRLDLAPDWTADVILLGQDTEARDSQYADRSGVRGRLGSSAQVPEGSRAQYGQAQLVVSGRLGEVRLKSSTGFGAQDLAERYDATMPGGAPRLFRQRNEMRMIANETRLWQPAGAGRFGWVLGTSIIDNRNTLTRALGEGVVPAPSADLGAGGTVSSPATPSFAAIPAATGVRNTVFEITGYGEASYRVLPALTLSAGLRVTRVELGGAGEDVSVQRALAGAAITAERRETAILPAASALLDIGSNARAYLRYQEGFRPGGLAVAGDFVRQFRSDHARTVELGTGWGLPGRGAFDIGASLSYTRWRDIQADFIDDGGLPSTANIGNGRIWAASVNGSARIAGPLRLEFGATLNDSNVDEPVIVPLTRLSRIPNIARFSGRAGLRWSRDFADGTRIEAEGWASYVGKSRLGIGPELGDLQGDYLDSGAIVRWGRDNAGLTLSVTNLADVVGNRFALGTPFATGRAQITPLQPRTVRIGFDTRF